MGALDEEWQDEVANSLKNILSTLADISQHLDEILSKGDSE
jgi:hypothetical protein